MRFLAAAVTLFAFAGFALSAAIPPSDPARRGLPGLPVVPPVPVDPVPGPPPVPGLPRLPVTPRGLLGNPDHTINARLPSNEA